MSGEAKTVSELCREALELVEGASTSGYQKYFDPCEGFAEKIKDAFCGGLDLSIQHDPTIPYRWTTDNEERIVAIFGNGPTSEANQKFHSFAANHIKQIAERCLELEEDLELVRDSHKRQGELNTKAWAENQKLREAYQKAISTLKWIANETDLQHCIDEAKETLKELGEL